MADKSEWIWMPHPGHFCAANRCRFHLNTCVGDFIVSTIGEYIPGWKHIPLLKAQIEAIPKFSKQIKREPYYEEFEEFGYDFDEVESRINMYYESMVFIARDDDSKCCPKVVANPGNVFEEIRYPTPDEARLGHMRLCDIWSKRNADYKE